MIGRYVKEYVINILIKPTMIFKKTKRLFL